MGMELVIRFGSGRYTLGPKQRGRQRAARDRRARHAVLRTPVETRGKDLTTVAEFEVAEGGPSVRPHLWAFTSAVPEPIDPADALRDTEEYWTEWCSHCTYGGEYRDLVMRSLITLKALTYAPTGGIVAAPTTSLPEELGGARNWDYRYCWLRDATFTLVALINSGYTAEAAPGTSGSCARPPGRPANMQIMYGINGQRRLLE